MRLPPEALERLGGLADVDAFLSLERDLTAFIEWYREASESARFLVARARWEEDLAPRVARIAEDFFRRATESGLSEEEIAEGREAFRRIKEMSEGSLGYPLADAVGAWIFLANLALGAHCESCPERESEITAEFEAEAIAWLDRLPRVRRKPREPEDGRGFGIPSA